MNFFQRLFSKKAPGATVDFWKDETAYWKDKAVEARAACNEALQIGREAVERLDKAAEVAELWRMRVVACDTAALSNTRESIKNRIEPTNPYFSAAYSAVCDTVDREIEYREKVAQLQVTVDYLNGTVSAYEKLIKKVVEELDSCDSYFIVESRDAFGESVLWTQVMDKTKTRLYLISDASVEELIKVSADHGGADVQSPVQS